MTLSESGQSGRFAFDGLDRILHEKARLGIMSSLVANQSGLLFTDLKDLCNLTDGNLNRHLQVLEEASLIEIWKGHSGKRPQTLVRLSAAGRTQFLAYISLLESIVAENLANVRSSAARRVSGSTDLGLSPL